MTEEENYPVVLLPILKELRCKIPWSEPEEDRYSYMRGTPDNAELLVYGMTVRVRALAGNIRPRLCGGLAPPVSWRLKAPPTTLRQSPPARTVRLVHPVARCIFLPVREEMEEWSLAASRQHLRTASFAQSNPNRTKAPIRHGWYLPQLSCPV